MSITHKQAKFKQFTPQNKMSANQLRVASLFAAGGAALQLSSAFNEAVQIFHYPTMQVMMDKGVTAIVSVFGAAVLTYAAHVFSKDATTKAGRDAARQAMANKDNVVPLRDAKPL